MAGEEQSKEWSGPSRRRVPRFVVQAPLDVTVLRSGIPDTMPGRSVNLGERGIAAMMAGELVAGETVGVELRLPLAVDPLRARALVRYQDKLRCGLEFVGLSAEQRASIRDWAKDTKALDPDVHRSAVSGIARTMDAAPGSLPNPPNPKAAIAEKSPSIAAPHAGTKWGLKAPDPALEKNLEKNKEREKKTADARRSGGLRGRAISGSAKKWSRVAWITFAAVAVLAVTAFWWRWNRGWDDLESGLKTEQAVEAEKPEAQVPAELMEKLLLHRVEPKYPPEARQAGLEGVIALDIVVGRDGSVVRMRPLNGPEVLARAATDALRWWKFEPYRVNGEPAVVETTVAVEFKR
jgi:TonB family protein